MKDAMLYKILRPLLKGFTIIFLRPKFIGLENIPKEGRIILAGNHTHILDCLLLISSTKRNVHFLAKDELWKGPKKIIFANMGLIPVNRRSKSHKSLELAIECLNKELVVGIFPEGTTEKEKKLLPFKVGAVKMASSANSMIVPFVIKGKYKLFSKDLTIKYLEPMKISNNIDKENERLRNIIKMERGD